MPRRTLAALALLSTALLLAPILAADGDGFIARVMRGTELIGLRYDPPYFVVRRTYFGAPWPYLHLGWLLVAPAVYVGLYAPTRPRDIFRAPLVLLFAFIFSIVAITWWTTEPGAGWISPRTAPILAYLVPATPRLRRQLSTARRHARQARARRKTRRLTKYLAQGLCPDCGYDLRATPQRCPECGF